jgi:predicted alpha-1,2-mannosidase
MIGDHTASVITSAYLKGISNTAPLRAYAIMRKNGFDQPEDIKDYKDGKGRRALTSYLKYGYIPMEDSVKYAYHAMEQVSRTLEYAYDDYALSLMAKKVNRSDDAAVLIKRAFNYTHVFDASVGFVRGRMEDGRWVQTFSPDIKESYITEGTPRQYTFYVPHDVPGLAKLMGGRDKLEQALDSLFLKDQYWHGNEPGHQIPFLYNFTAANWKTQKVVREILAREYTDGPGGLGGNDDAGQMSAWYMFGAMGFYPVNPVSGEYLLSSPIFDRVTISLANGKAMKIVCHKSSKTAFYIKAVRLNGQNYYKNYIRYDNLVNGGKLDIFLQDRPAKSWGSKLSDQPSGLGADDSAK